MYYYAVLNSLNICTEIIPSDTLVSDPTLIQIESEDYSLIGMYWNGTEFVIPPASIGAAHSTDNIGYKGTDMYLSEKLDNMDSAIDGKAAGNHTHSASDVGAAEAVHTHTEYAPTSHNHDDDYAPSVHNHHDDYAQIAHSHTLSSLGAAAENHTHSLDSFTETSGKKIMTAAERDKLATVEENANNYAHPASHPASMIDGLAAVATSGSYNDLSNKPTIPAAYTHPESHPATMISGLSDVATSGDYNDLSNKPTIPAAYSHPASHPASMISGLSAVATSGSYADLSNKPEIPDALSDLTDDATHRTVTDTEKAAWNAKSSFSGNYNDLTNKPTIPGALADLTEDSTHRTVTDAEKLAWTAKSGFSGSYNDLTDKPTIPAAYTHPSTHPASMITGLSTVATSGSYADLTNKPTIPAAYSHPASHPASMITGLSDVATSGDYADLTNKPAIPAEYTHPANHPASMITGLSGVATSGSYNDLTDKPSIPSAYTHPANHPASMITGLSAVATSGKYSDLEGTPTIPEAYTHPAYTAKTSALYKVAVDNTGHVSAATAVSKADIVALGIPAVNTTYGNATQSNAGLQSAADKTKLDGIETGANKTIVDTALSSASTNPVQNKVINAALADKAPVNHSHNGNIIVQQASSPYMRLTLTDKTCESRIYKNASGTADYGTTIADYDNDGAKDSLIFCRGNALANKLYLNVQNDDDSRSIYYLYGEHHKPTAAEVGALATTGGTVNGNVTVNGEIAASGVLRSGGQQAFYFASSSNTQTIGTNNATGGTTIACGSSADVTVNGARMQIPSLLPRNGGTFQIGNTSNRFSGIYLVNSPNVSSDERLKRDISALDTDELSAFINALNVVEYNYKADKEGEKKRIGLIAQDVFKANPDIADFFVEKDANGYLGLKPADLVFPLIAAVQKLAKEVEELKNR